MIVKGIIEKLETKYQARVRIPEYHKISSDPLCTPTNELPIASIMTKPGVSPTYVGGDIVYLGFENDSIQRPVILGLLYRNSKTSATSDISVSALNVSETSVLPEATSIGDVESNSIQSLKNLNSNLLNRFDSITNIITPVVNYSNPNLLDNGWFTVNQRGSSSYTEGYSLDRWFNQQGKVTVLSNGVQLDYNTAVDQVLGDNLLNAINGKTVTVSVKRTDGSIGSVTFIARDDITKFYYMFGSDIRVCMFRLSRLSNSIVLQFYKQTSGSVSIRAVKLELGTVSTLGNDMASTNANELIRCSSSTADANDTYANKAYDPFLRDKMLGLKSDYMRIVEFNGHTELPYACIARVKITRSYVNMPITWVFNQRTYGICILTLTITNSATTSSTVRTFKYMGSVVQAVAVQVASDTIEIYVKQSEGYDRIEIYRQVWPNYMNGVTITNPCTTVAALPSGTATTATNLYVTA